MSAPTRTFSVNDGGLLSAVFIVFLVLKLTGTVDWSWWWVTAPLWIPLGLVILFAMFFILPYLIVNATKGRGRR